MKIWLCDLTHDQQVVAADTFPTNVAYVGAYLLDHSKYNHTIRIFKYPGKLLRELEKGNLPDLIGFSYFMWNARLSYEIAKEIKNLDSAVPIVFGGLNYPIDPHRQIEWLEHHSSVDFCVYKEGEVAFQLLVDAITENKNNLAAVRKLDIPGVHYIRSDRSYALPEPAPRVRNLNSFRSPYLSGMLDEFFDGDLMPLLTTNRGCPFTCTFCAEGQSYYSKVNRLSVDRVHDEIHYIGAKTHALSQQGCRVRYDLFVTDSNFGMYKEDLLHAQALREAKQKYGWPTFVNATTGKNKKDRVLSVAKTLDGAISVAGSVQSLNADVLKNIKRTNIDSSALLGMANEAEELGAKTYSDVILGLPGDSLSGHIDTVFELLDAGYTALSLYQLGLYNDAEMGTDHYREQFGLKGRFRALQRAFGSYKFSGKYLNIAEIEEMCVEGNDLPFSDYLDARYFDLAVGVFYFDKLFECLLIFLRKQGIAPSKWVSEVITQIKTNQSYDLHHLFNEFKDASSDELFLSEKELVEFTSSKETMNRFLSGELGANLLGKYRILSITMHFDELCEIARSAAITLLPTSTDLNHDADGHRFIGELVRYDAGKKRNLYDLNARSFEDTFSFDIDLFLKQPKHKYLADYLFTEPRAIRFSRTEDGQRVLSNSDKTFGSDNIMSIYKQWSWTPSNDLVRDPTIFS